MLSVETYQKEFVAYLEKYAKAKEPKNLYEPVQYILGLGGKRLRPVLTLMMTDAFNGDYKQALNAALSIEVFHNFSLVHDDIMDDAPLRRGKATVHEKWDVNTGILSGDAMLIMAYQLFENYHEYTFKELARLFSKTALEVCEGQQYDVDFETRDDVTIREYINMITCKTAVLLGAAMQMGAIIAGASHDDETAVYEFGKCLGIAFQLQDDYLDAFGNPETFGKQVGGDIIENKKTYLYLKAMEFASEEDQIILKDLFSKNTGNTVNKVETVKGIFIASGAAEATKEAIQQYTREALNIINFLNISRDKKAQLKAFGEQLMNRQV